METVLEEVNKLQKSFPKKFLGGVRFVMDNAKQHVAFIKSVGDRALPHPPHSPDFNKPVEHMFNSIKMAFQQRLTALLREVALTGATVPFKRSKRLMGEIINEVVKVEALKKDAATMKDTYQAVLLADGGRVPKQFR
jgi:hypothetical protein